MRINKYMAHKGISTRKGADELIARGKVYINGHIAKLGDKVLESDNIKLIGDTSSKKYLYFAYNKPVGVITHSPQLGEKDIKQSVKNEKEMSDTFPIGRLDKDSSGLIILTNDGRVTDRLLNPEYDHDKEYQVRTERPLRISFKKKMEGGININGYITRPCSIRKTGPKSFNITLTEGKKHQIRRMVSILYNAVISLERIRILNIRLENLKPGEHRPITGDELTTFLEKIELK